MAITIPSEVALFLNICGIPYPDINEDDVRALARHVRTFSEQVQDTHDSATGVINQMGAFYSGESYQQLVATWANMSATHMRQLDSACKFVGKALEVAATVITAVKAAVLAELAALAASYASMMITPPLAPTAPLVVAAARRLCEQMAQYLVGYVVAEVVGKAIEPLEQAIDDMVKGIVYDATRDALDIPSSNGVTPLRIDPDAVQHFAKVLDDHADDIMRHAATFAENVSTLDFTTSTPFDDVGEHIPTGAGASHGPALMVNEFPLRPSAQSETRLGPTSPAVTGDLGAHRTDYARVPVAARDAANAVGAGERPVDRDGSEGRAGEPVRAGDRSAASAATAGPELRDPASHPARNYPASGVTPNGVEHDAVKGSGGLELSRVMPAHAAADAGAVAPRDAEVPAWPVSDSDARQPGWASEAAGPADHETVVDRPAVESSVSADAVNVPPLAQQDAGAASTPWGRAVKQPGPPTPAPPKPEHPAKATPKVRRPAVTPWTRTRRTRDVPAVVHAPSARPPLRLVREKGSEANSDEGAGLADASPAPSRVTAPASDRTAPPPSHG
ncbi:WXG100 family type VII secretion target [Nocardia sp. NPDC051900]|uniref:WXG100 family type VII secretion target n=1 Tax=Nocardia sp. NPDC051900 TaxID=3364326 RepID=UPI0037944F4C